MCKALFWVWNLRSEDFFWVWNFVVTFFGWQILARTFLGVVKKRNPGFSFLCQTILSVSFTKERWTQKLCGLFLGYVLGRWTFFGPGSSPVTNIPGYPPWGENTMMISWPQKPLLKNPFFYLFCWTQCDPPPPLKNLGYTPEGRPRINIMG